MGWIELSRGWWINLANIAEIVFENDDEIKLCHSQRSYEPLVIRGAMAHRVMAQLAKLGIDASPKNR